MKMQETANQASRRKLGGRNPIKANKTLHAAGGDYMNNNEPSDFVLPFQYDSNSSLVNFNKDYPSKQRATQVNFGAKNASSTKRGSLLPIDHSSDAGRNSAFSKTNNNSFFKNDRPSMGHIRAHSTLEMNNDNYLHIPAVAAPLEIAKGVKNDLLDTFQSMRQERPRRSLVSILVDSHASETDFRKT